MKSGQVWLLVACIGIGAMFGAARGNAEKEAFLSKPVRETCNVERCITSKPVANKRLLER